MTRRASLLLSTTLAFSLAWLPLQAAAQGLPHPSFGPGTSIDHGVMTAPNSTGGTFSGGDVSGQLTTPLGGGSALSIAALAAQAVGALQRSGGALTGTVTGGTFNYPNLNNARIGLGADAFQGLFNNYHFGSGKTAVTVSTIGNSPGEAPEVMGGIGTSLSTLALYPTTDSVTRYGSNVGPPAALAVSGVTYDATHAYFSPALTAAQVVAIPVGMVVTASAPDAPYRAVVAAVAADGTSLTTTPIGWAQRGDDSASYVPPAGTLTANPISRAWVDNLNCFLTSQSYASEGVCAEWGVFNNTGVYNPATDTPTTGGLDIAQLGSANSSYAFRARGPFQFGFDAAANAGSQAGFLFDPQGYAPTNHQVGVGANPSIAAFASYQSGGNVIAVQPATVVTTTVPSRTSGGVTSITVASGAGIAVGAYVTSSPFVNRGTTVTAVSGNVVTISAKTNGVLKAGTSLSFVSVGAKTFTLDSAGNVTANGATLAVPLPAASGGTGNAGGPWPAFTPTVAAASGSLASASGAGNGIKVGRTFSFRVTATITADTNGSGGINVGMPYTAAGPCVVAGRSTAGAAAGKMLQGLWDTGSASIFVTNYDNTYPAGSGYTLKLSGVCETTM